MADVAELDQAPMSVRCGGQFQLAVDAGLLADADPATDTTVTLLKARLDTNLATSDASLGSMVDDTKDAFDKALELGVISETHGVATMVLLIAETNADAGERQGFRG